MVEFTFSFTHTNTTAFDVDADVGAHARVDFIALASQTLPDRGLGDSKLRGRHVAVVVFHPQAPITPNHCGPARGASCLHPWSPIHGLFGLGLIGLQPVVAGRRRGEGACAAFQE